MYMIRVGLPHHTRGVIIVVVSSGCGKAANRDILHRAELCVWRHFGLNIPKLHVAVHIGCKSFESWH